MLMTAINPRIVPVPPTSPLGYTAIQKSMSISGQNAATLSVTTASIEKPYLVQVEGVMGNRELQFKKEIHAMEFYSVVINDKRFIRS
jgi:hypothetical protein